MNQTADSHPQKFCQRNRSTCGSRRVAVRSARSSRANANAYHFNEEIQPVWTKAPLAPGEPGKDYKPTCHSERHHAAVSRGRWREGVPSHL